MTDVLTEIRRRGGAAKTCELLAAGATQAGLGRAVRAGTLDRVRKGWYVHPATSTDLKSALRVGGRATCVTALRAIGVWVTGRDPIVHVAVHRSTSQLRSADDMCRRQSGSRDAVVHWRETPKPRDALGSRLTEPIAVALLDATRCLSDEDLFASAESVRAKNLISRQDWLLLLARSPRRVRRVLARVGDRSGSGLESLAVFRLRRRGIRVRQQVQIGPDRVDILIGRWLVIELDGREFHDPARDRRRDARLVAAGYAVLRFGYGQVIDEWDTVVAAIDSARSRRRRAG